MPELITLTQAVKYLEQQTGQTVTTQTLRHWITTGRHGAKLKARRIGRRYYVRPEWLDQFLDDAHAAYLASRNRAKQQDEQPAQPTRRRRTPSSTRALLRKRFKIQ